jgi:hypothetical protein
MGEEGGKSVAGGALVVGTFEPDSRRTRQAAPGVRMCCSEAIIEKYLADIARSPQHCRLPVEKINRWQKL